MAIKLEQPYGYTTLSRVEIKVYVKPPLPPARDSQVTVGLSCLQSNLQI